MVCSNRNPMQVAGCRAWTGSLVATIDFFFAQTLCSCQLPNFTVDPPIFFLFFDVSYSHMNTITFFFTLVQ